MNEMNYKRLDQPISLVKSHSLIVILKFQLASDISAMGICRSGRDTE